MLHLDKLMLDYSNICFHSFIHSTLSCASTYHALRETQKKAMTLL